MLILLAAVALAVGTLVVLGITLLARVRDLTGAVSRLSRQIEALADQSVERDAPQNPAANDAAAASDAAAPSYDAAWFFEPITQSDPIIKTRALGVGVTRALARLRNRSAA